MWERACPRRRCVSRWKCRLIHRFREQARSHIGDASATDAAQGPAISATPLKSTPHTNQNCGSGLAREGGVSVAGSADGSAAFAGKPAPTLGDASSADSAQGPAIFSHTAKIQASHQSKMWERACSRRRCVSRWKCRLTHRFREQAHSHTQASSRIKSAPFSATISTAAWVLPEVTLGKIDASTMRKPCRPCTFKRLSTTDTCGSEPMAQEPHRW
jgi:hypothetical protein